MTEYFIQFTHWVTRIATAHNVDPLIWGGLFLSGKVLFVLCIGRAIKNRRLQQSVSLPLFFASLSYSIQHFYVIIAGRDIPVWIYLLMGALFIFGTFTAWQKTTAKHKPQNTGEIL